MHKQYFYAKIETKICILDGIMEKQGLSELIKYLEMGTNLHIGVLFFGSYGNELCRLSHDREIHSSPLCEKFKSAPHGYRRCFRCRNMALHKTLEEKRPFGGICSNGIYEYTHPIVVDGEVAAMIFIGNIMPPENEKSRLDGRIGQNRELMETLEQNLGADDARSIAKIIEEYVLRLFEVGGTRKEGADTLIENIKAYLRSNIEFNVSTAHIASVFHYNKSYLGRRFKEETGVSIAEYLNAQRIELAKNYLTKTRLTVIEIAEKCGFSEIGYFNRLFKSKTGKTPTEYRRLCKISSVM